MNSTIYNTLIVNIINNQHGKVVAKITELLLLKPSSIRDLWIRSKMPYYLVRRALIVLLHHSYLLHTSTEPIVCSVDQNKILFSLKYPQLIALVQYKYGDISKEIISYLISYGILNFRDVNSLIQAKNLSYDEESIKNAFSQLISGKYIIRKSHSIVESFERTSTPAPTFNTVLPNAPKKKGRKRSQPEVPIERPASKRPKTGIDVTKIQQPNNTESDDNFDDSCVWTINVDIFTKEITLYTILEMVKTKFDECAVKIVDKMWELSACGKTYVEFITLCGNLHEITQDTIKKYLDVMIRDQPFLISKKKTVAGTESTSYMLNVGNATTFLKGKELESAISAKYGAVACSIHRLLKMKHLLTDVQIADMLIGDIKEIRQALFKMNEDGYVSIQEVPRSNNLRTTKSSFYLWSVNLASVNTILLRETAHAIICTTDRLKKQITEAEPLIAKYIEGQQLGQFLLNVEEMKEYDRLDKCQRFLIDSLYNLSDMFFVLKDF
ncbi:DNA-directed RNA polymerase III subunit RPC3 [Entamoeba marina]